MTKLLSTSFAFLFLATSCGTELTQVRQAKGVTISYFPELPAAALSDAQTAFDMLQLCGVDLPHSIVLSRRAYPIEYNLITCAKAEVGGETIWLNSDFSLFDGPCGKGYLDVLGHEMLHLAGYDHKTSEQKKEYNNILRGCGFKIL